MRPCIYFKEWKEIFPFSSIFFSLLKRKKIFYFGRCHFFSQMKQTKVWCTSLESYICTSSMKLTQNTGTDHSIEPFLPTHNLHRHHRPPIKTIILIHRQHLRHLPLRRRCLYCLCYFKQQSSNGATRPLV